MAAAAAAATLIPLFSPAAAADWASHFLAHATELDATGFPLRGSFGFGFGCYTDLSVAPNAAVRRTVAEEAIRAEWTRTGHVLTPTELGAKVRQICTAYEELHPGCVVAFKKGISVVAIARITSDYRYEPTHELKTWANHRWDYEIIQKLPLEIPLPGRNATYYRNGYLYTPPPPVPVAAEPPAPPAAAPVFCVPEDAVAAVPTAEERIAALERQVAALTAALATLGGVASVLAATATATATA